MRPRMHILDDEDEALMRRWKGSGLGVYPEHLVDNEYEAVFACGSFVLNVKAAAGGVPLFTDDDRALLRMFLDEREAIGSAVKE